MRSFCLAVLLCLISGIRSAEINYNNATYSCSEIICDLSCKANTDLCKHIAIIGTIDETTKTFTPFKTAVILGKQFMITTVSSGFATDFNANVQMIYFPAQTNDGYLFLDRRISSTDAQLIPGDFDPHGWNDIMLIKLKTPHSNSGNSVDVAQDPEKKRPQAMARFEVARYGFVVTGSNGIVLKKDITTHSPEDCKKYFAYDETIFFDEDLMYCQSDEDAKQPPTAEQSKWLSGLPVFDTFTEKAFLVGLRSIQSSDPHRQGAFLVTKLKYHCEWIAYHDAEPCISKLFYYN
uniref:Peptidase S1 domain-containing protein n=1 Tax=Panagrellus redivivus TaxID=6233 RepID=A0A7E4ZX52_PANRE